MCVHTHKHSGAHVFEFIRSQFRRLKKMQAPIYFNQILVNHNNLLQLHYVRLCASIIILSAATMENALAAIAAKI